MSTKILSCKEPTELSSPSEICNLFGIARPGHRNTHLWTDPRDHKTYRIWWVEENYEDENGQVAGDWYAKQEYDEEGTWLQYSDLTSSRASEEFVKATQRNRHKTRLVFTAAKNAAGERVYNFEGVYKLVTYVWKKRINGEIYHLCTWGCIDSTFTLPE